MFKATSFAMAALVLSALPTVAEEQKLSGTQIEDVLSGQVIKSDVSGTDWTQYFGRDGSTEYSAGSRPSHGRWKAEGDQYCSVWPPVTDWACYDVLRDTTGDGRTRIIWISDKGARTTGLVGAD